MRKPTVCRNFILDAIVWTSHHFWVWTDSILSLWVVLSSMVFFCFHIGYFKRLNSILGCILKTLEIKFGRWRMTSYSFINSQFYTHHFHFNVMVDGYFFGVFGYFWAENYKWTGQKMNNTTIGLGLTYLESNKILSEIDLSFFLQWHRWFVVFVFNRCGFARFLRGLEVSIPLNFMHRWFHLCSVSRCIARS